MREILFKAERIDNGKWVEGSYAIHPKGECSISVILDKCQNPPDSDPMWQKVLISHEVNPDTVCQYIGKKDKNGNRIWENDICICIYNGRRTIRIIVWDASELDFKGTNGKEKYGLEFDYLGCCEEIEVIGNIFDNPELLKEITGR